MEIVTIKNLCNLISFKKKKNQKCRISTSYNFICQFKAINLIIFTSKKVIKLENDGSLVYIYVFTKSGFNTKLFR